VVSGQKHVMIDGYNLGLEKGTGVATYARNLSYALRDLGHMVSVLYGNKSSASRDQLLREITFFDTKDDDRGGGMLDIIDQVQHAVRGPLGRAAVEVPMTGRVISDAFHAKMPHYDKIYNSADVFKRTQSSFMLWGELSSVRVPQKPDLAHWTYPLPLRVKGVPNIYTLHDIVPLRLPHTTLDNKRRYLNLLRKLSDKADHFVTVSECSKRDIVDIVGISPDRITNTYQSVEIPEHLRNKPEQEVAREVEGLLGVGYKDYFLFWGSIEPKKNIGRIIEAYLASRVDAPLVIVGAQAWKSKRELRLLEAGGAMLNDLGNTSRRGVIRLSYVPFSLLVSLIRGARAALFPSLYEGFGLPALEAMLLGTPVICSNGSSLPEVAGDAALMVDPYDVAAITDAIRRIDGDADLRIELTGRGSRQVARFTPALYRDRLNAVYQRLM
jgi:glycosyltransferase involved in cell wall biosynthesis